jgi:hypothetical protein
MTVGTIELWSEPFCGVTYRQLGRPFVLDLPGRVTAFEQQASAERPRDVTFRQQRFINFTVSTQFTSQRAALMKTHS